MAFIRGVLKNSPWVVIAVVLHVVAIAVLGIVYVKSEQQAKDDPLSVGISNTKPTDEAIKDEPKDEPLIDRTAIPKANNDADAPIEATDVLTGDTATAIGDDAPSTNDSGAVDPNYEAGAPSGGTAIGVGRGPGHFGTGKPSAFVGRKAGNGTGGPRKGESVQTYKAVMDGLVWLMRHQQPDGSWSVDKLAGACDKDACCGDAKVEMAATYNEGVTGLALLAFLGFGADHQTKWKLTDEVRKTPPKRVGEIVTKGLLWLEARQKAHEDGRFTDDGQTYNEALATLAMCEAYGMTNYPRWKVSAQAGIKFLLASQRMSPNGAGLWGWRYRPRGYFENAANMKPWLGSEGLAENDEKSWKKAQYESDLSATTWVVMALKSAELVGIEVPVESPNGAMEFVKYVTVKDRGIAYMDPLQVGRKVMSGDPEEDKYGFHPSTLDALGMCCRTFITKDAADPVLEWSAARIAKDAPASKDKLAVDYYYWYYATLALNQFDGPGNPKRTNKYWRPWEKALVETLLPLQEDKKTCGHGGWPTPDRWSLAGGPIYRTAINVLTLEVYYRYGNVFGTSDHEKKREERGRDDKAREGEKKDDTKDAK
jgi:hypothetical protein